MKLAAYPTRRSTIGRRWTSPCRTRDQSTLGRQRFARISTGWCTPCERNLAGGHPGLTTDMVEVAVGSYVENRFPCGTATGTSTQLLLICCRHACRYHIWASDYRVRTRDLAPLSGSISNSADLTGCRLDCPPGWRQTGIHRPLSGSPGCSNQPPWVAVASARSYPLRTFRRVRCAVRGTRIAPPRASRSPLRRRPGIPTGVALDLSLPAAVAGLVLAVALVSSLAELDLAVAPGSV